MKQRFVNLRLPAGGDETEAAEILVEDGKIVKYRLNCNITFVVGDED